MKEKISQQTSNGLTMLNELLATIQADIKFFKEMEDGTFSLEEKSVPEILSIIRKRKQSL